MIIFLNSDAYYAYYTYYPYVNESFIVIRYSDTIYRIHGNAN